MTCRFRLLRLRETVLAIKRSWRESRRSCFMLLVCGAILSFGCEPSSFNVPADGPQDDDSEAVSALPASSSMTSSGLEAESVGARSIELVMDRRNSDEAEAVRAAARMQAGQDKVKLRTSILGEQDLPARQFEMVREALSRQPLALIVEPADPTNRRLVEVLHKARSAGVPIVLLNRPLSGDQSGTSDESRVAPKGGPPGGGSAQPPVSDAERPMILVAPASFESSARQLVASAIRNAKNAKLDPKSGAIIIINPVGDPFLQDRTDALRAAIKASGISTIEEIPFVQDIEVGAKFLKARLKANNKLTLVFSIDSLSSSANRTAMNELGQDRPYILAGYSAEDSFADLPKVGDFAALASFAPVRVVRRAIDTAVALTEGRAVPDRVEIPIVVHDSPEKSALPMSPTYGSKVSPTTKARPGR
jgi:ABC-type sugar transport system substrate-binding protein